MTTPRDRPAVTIEARALDLTTAAQVYALSETILASLIAHHDFPHVRIGRRVVIPVALADAWFADRSSGIPLAVAS